MKLFSRDTTDAAASVDSRRGFLRGSASLGAGVLMTQALSSHDALAQAAQPSAPAATPTAAPAAPLKQVDVLTKARQVLMPICRVCPQCDGVACAGEFPGFGGIGTGKAFQNNYTALRAAKFNQRTIHAVSTQDVKPDTSTTIFGRKLAVPVMAAPLGGIKANFGGRITDRDFFEALIAGCNDAGVAGAIGDSPNEPMEAMKARVDVIARNNGFALAGIKPRPNPNFIQVVRWAEQANAFMITVDTDSAARWRGNPREYAMEPKSVAQLREIVKSTRIPVVVKGIMTPDEALLALEAGVAGIVVSNHGGRVLDDTPGVAEVLPDIAAKVKGKMVIFADGTVRYGDDVLKYMALGADCVLAGRHLARAVFGGGRQGVALFVNQMKNEMQAAMVMTGVGKVGDISPRLIAARHVV